MDASIFHIVMGRIIRVQVGFFQLRTTFTASPPPFLTTDDVIKQSKKEVEQSSREKSSLCSDGYETSTNINSILVSELSSIPESVVFVRKAFTALHPAWSVRSSLSSSSGSRCICAIYYLNGTNTGGLPAGLLVTYDSTVT